MRCLRDSAPSKYAIVGFLVWVSSFQNLTAQSLVYSTAIDYHVSDTAWSPDGSLIAVSGSEGVRVYSETLQEVAHFQEDATRYALSLSWSPDSTMLATLGEGSIFIWKRHQDDRFTLERRLALEGYVQLLVSWSPDGSMIASMDLADTGNPEVPLGFLSHVNLWDTKMWELVRTFPEDYYYEYYQLPFALAWSADSSQVATSGVSTEGIAAYIVDVSTGEQLYAFSQVEMLTGLGWNANGELAVGGGIYLTIYDANRRQILTDFGYPSQPMRDVRDVLWSPDGTRLLAYDFVNGSAIWDPVTGAHVTVPYTYALTWSPDGSKVAGAAVDQVSLKRMLYVWDVADLPDTSGIPTVTPYPTFRPN